MRRKGEGPQADEIILTGKTRAKEIIVGTRAGEPVVTEVVDAERRVVNSDA